jgi:hypothetical protein
VPLTSTVVVFQELMLEHNEVVCQQKSPAPSLVKGTEMAVAGLQMAAALALVATPMTDVSTTIRTVSASEKRLTFDVFISILLI